MNVWGALSKLVSSFVPGQPPAWDSDAALRNHAGPGPHRQVTCIHTSPALKKSLATYRLHDVGRICNLSGAQFFQL